MPETSVGVRWKFSVDSTQRVTAGMDSSAHQRSTSRAYRRLPSRMMPR